MSLAPSRPTAKPPGKPEGERRTLLRGVGWDGYQALREWFGDDAPRMTYADGDVEIMSPLNRHERSTKLLGFMVETIAEELEIPIASFRSATIGKRSADRSVEPDECYYFTNLHPAPTGDRIDLEIDPPPDLAIEVEISHRLLPKLPLYARLGFPEIWHYDGETLSVLCLDPGGEYRKGNASGLMPFLPLGRIAAFLEPSIPDEIAWRRRFRAWVRETLAPAIRPPELEG